MLILCSRCAFKCVLFHVLLFDYSEFDFCAILLACFIARCYALLNDSFHASFIYFSQKCFVYCKMYCISTSLDLKCFCSTVKMWCSWILVLEYALFVSCIFMHIMHKCKNVEVTCCILLHLPFTIFSLSMQAFTTKFYFFFKCLCDGYRKQNLLTYIELQNSLNRLHTLTI
jgi:hypothetical protein